VTFEADARTVDIELPVNNRLGDTGEMLVDEAQGGQTVPGDRFQDVKLNLEGASE
jgi:hypothetical protein